MAFVQSGGEDAKASGLTLNLPSNNPFRNRAASPLPSGQLSPREPPPRPVSRNPFLDDAGAVKESLQRIPSPASKPMALTGSAAELFDELTLDDKPRPPRPTRTLTDGSRAENIPPNGCSSHRPTRSQEQNRRPQGPPGPPRLNKPRPTEELDIFADPVDVKPTERRPRRNSESSIMDRPGGNGKQVDPVEEKKEQDRRRRERRNREREALRDPKNKKPSRKLDIIDQLDATSIYGTGLFHHDGPFDACNPNRNRAGSRRAPMQAFPKDSLNNALVGGPPIAKRSNHATFLGNNDEEAFKDYSTGRGQGGNYEAYAANGARAQASVQSATSKVEPVHGDESLGLGTSTFLEGAPASRAAIQKTAAETAAADNAAAVKAGGLARKKSLAQKIRGINNPRREYAPGPRRGSSNDARPTPGSPEGNYSNARPRTNNENNPFQFEFGAGVADRKDSITFAEPENKPARSPGSPGGSPGERLERRATTDNTGSEEAPKQTMGFLSRVKSIKGGPRRPKAEKPVFD